MPIFIHKSSIASVAVALFLTFFATNASAQPSMQPPPPPPPQTETSPRAITVTLSTLQLGFELFEAQGALRLAPKWEAAAQLGYLDDPGTFMTGGAEARYYVAGDTMHGLSIGVRGSVWSSGELLAGPTIRFKHVFRSGFTLEAATGLPLVGYTDGVGEGDEVLLALAGAVLWTNLNVGWSF